MLDQWFSAFFGP